MFNQLLQIAIAVFAAGCAWMVLQTVADVLPELLALRSPEPRLGEPVPVPIERGGAHRPL